MQTGSVAKNILATFCSSGEQVVVTTSCIVSEFLQQNPKAFSMPFDDRVGFNDDQRVAPILPES
jgi:hypothetical protein